MTNLSLITRPQLETGCRFSEGHGPCGGASNGLYCQNHQDCRNGCDCEGN